VVKNGENAGHGRTAKPVRLTISLPPEDYLQLQRQAGELRVSLAWVVRNAVSSYLTQTGDPPRPHGTKGSKKP